MKNDFEGVWKRIKAETGLKSLKNLAEIVKITQPAVSEMKAKNKFPAGWAYLVGKKYGLLTEWIMTGEGPKKLEELYKSRGLAILDEFEEWISEEIRKEPEKKIWFKIQIQESFPGFKAWKEEKEGGKEFQVDLPSQKVA